MKNCQFYNSAIRGTCRPHTRIKHWQTSCQPAQDNPSYSQHASGFVQSSTKININAERWDLVPSMDSEQWILWWVQKSIFVLVLLKGTGNCKLSGCPKSIQLSGNRQQNIDGTGDCMQLKELANWPLCQSCHWMNIHLVKLGEHMNRRPCGSLENLRNNSPMLTEKSWTRFLRRQACIMSESP